MIECVCFDDWDNRAMCCPCLNEDGECNAGQDDHNCRIATALKAVLADPSLVLIARPIGMAGFMEQTTGAAKGER